VECEANSSPGALWITFRFGILALPIGILLPMGIALLMNNKWLKGQNFFRSAFYMPYIIPFVASIFLWVACSTAKRLDQPGTYETGSAKYVSA